jgi:hypothetical protein
MSWCRLSCGAAAVLLLGHLVPGPAAEAPSKARKASEQDHWAFQPVKRPHPPEVRDRSWVRNPIDAFVLARLEKIGLKPAPPADKRTLLRRVYFDLIGLPPTPREVQAFLDDHSPQAFARVVDDLLSRPQYGERWARHWFDVARYAETNGYERDGAKPNAWRYRDYVIDSFNCDKPYDCFLTEQLAGDEMQGSNAETQIATTFLRLGTWDDEPADPLVDRYDQLDDVLGTTATAFLGVTLRCARCHDHKFEPFSQKDYYRMLAVFEPLRRPQKGRADLDLVVGSEAELAAHRAAVARIDAEVARAILQGASLGNPMDARDDKAARRRLQQRVAALVATRLAGPPRAYIWHEAGPKAPITRIFRRGDPNRPLGEVGPGLPEVLVRRQPEPPRPLAKSTGRRLWLARWMTRPDNPLVARVMVNRLWQRHFGAGLVTTANDFGVMGEPPSHPELLDWLASEFVAGGWRLKRIHRLMVLSNTYQMSAAANPAAARKDPDGALLWHWRARRLEAEAVRDGVLTVSGRLNPYMTGPSVYPPLPRAVLEGQSRPGQGWGKSNERQSARRSVYIHVKRVLAVPELELLDAPDTTCSCEQRPVSTTAPQALTFLNGDFMHQQAGHFAGRLRREAGSDVRAQVRRAFEVAFSRPPRAEEVKLALAFLAAQQRQVEADAAAEKKPAGDARLRALRAFCLVVLNTNEFVYLN